MNSDKEKLVAELIGELLKIDEHRNRALDLIRELRPDRFSKLLGIETIDLFIIVHLDAQNAPQSQNAIIREIRARYPASRAECASRLARLETNGVIERSAEVKGRGGGIRWILKTSQVEAIETMDAVEKQLDKDYAAFGPSVLPNWY